MSIDEQPMNVYWSGKRTETNNNFKTNYKGSVATKNNLPNLGNKTGDMYNVAESGENFIWNGNSWDSLSGDTLKTLNWQKTEKAGAVAIYPVPETVIEPTVDFLFTETGPASGDKGAENPSTITGVTSVKVTRCGKNLLTKIPMASTMPQRGITVTYNADGSIHLSGTASSSSFPYLRFFTVDPGIVPSILAADTTLTVSLTCSDSNVYCVLYDSDSSTLLGNGTAIYPGTPVTHTMSANVKTANLSIFVAKGAVVNCDVYIQVEFGQSATEWEAPAGEDYLIPLGSTYYGGSIDLSTGVMTVTHYIFEMNGTEWWTSDNNDGVTLRAYNSETGIGYSYCIPRNLMGGLQPVAFNSACTHFPVAPNNFSSESVQDGTQATPGFCLVGGGDQFRVAFPFSTLTAWKQWLADQKTAGTPVKATVKLATPYTVQLTPPQILSLSQPDKYTPRLNTVYTDAQAVQVGYAKSPIRSEYELTQAIIATEGGE